MSDIDLSFFNFCFCFGRGVGFLNAICLILIVVECEQVYLSHSKLMYSRLEEVN